MSLPVPLTVRIGDTHVTREVAAVGFRKEAVGGVRNIRLRLARPLDRFDANLAAYSRIYLYDARSGVTIAEGRLSDFGRSAGNDGQQWDIIAFGPAQHASDKQVPYVIIDQSVGDGWRRIDSNAAGGQNGTGTRPDDAADNGAEGLILQFPQGQALVTNSRVTMRYERLRESGQKLGGFQFTRDCGVTDAGYDIQGVTRTDGGAGENAATNTFSTAAATSSGVVVTNFPNGRNTLDFRILRNGAGVTVGNDTTWGAFLTPIIRALIYDAAGNEITAGYSTQYVLAHTVVNDLLGRVLDQFDGANAVVSTAGTHQIDQLAYPDGVTAAQVLDDLMLLEPAFYWTTGPSDPITSKFAFEWKAWPTTVRYEVTLDDGASLPASMQEVYNQATVRYRDLKGLVRSVLRTKAVAAFDDATPPVVRRVLIDLGDEVGSASAATRAGDNFLTDHNAPNNAGTITISRPIHDLITGALVQPFEIEPGALIRVRGIESYPDSLNASSNDGMTVFRIWSMDYDSDSNSAPLELDTYSRTTANAIARLSTRRNRRR